MAKASRRDKTLFELHPELERGIDEMREEFRRMGILGKFKFS